MNELITQKQNFNNQIHKIKEFSKKVPTSVNLPTTNINDSLFGFFDHKVTGEEFNKLAKSIQKYLISTNGYVVKIIKEFSEIYNTFDKLDKEYLNGIIIGVKAAEVASNQARDASFKAQGNAEDIRKIISAQKITIDKLVEFKEQFEKIESLHDFEKNWNYIQNIKDQIQSIQDDFVEKTNRISNQITVQEQRIIKQEEVIIELFEEIPSSDLQAEIKEVSQAQAKQNHNFNNEIESIQDDISEYKYQTHEQIKEQGKKIVEQKKDFIELLNNLSFDISAKINVANETQAEQNKDLNREIKSIQDNVNETNKQTNEQIALQDQRVSKQKEDFLRVLDNLSSDISAKIDSVNQIQAEQYKKLNGEIKSIQDSFNENTIQTNQQIAVQEQRITKQEHDFLKSLDTLSSDISTKIDSVNQIQAEQNNKLNREIKSIQDNFNENKNQTNQQIAVQEQKVTKQKEDFLKALDNLSSDISTKIDSVNQTQAEQNQNLNREINLIHSDIAWIKNKIKIQERQFSKKIITGYIMVGIFGSISLIHLILNSLGVL